MKEIRFALGVIGVAYGLLALVVAYFAVNAGGRPNIGAAYLAAWILGWGGTVAATGLLTGSMLGTVALVRHAESRRPLPILVILTAWTGALVLGWLTWQFWTHSSIPRVPA